MAERQSLGLIEARELSLPAINDAFRMLSERVDGLKGLRGRVSIFDRVRVDPPTEAQDAVNLGALDDPGDVVFTGGAQTITGVKTVQGVAMRWTDSAGVLIHAFGTQT